MILQEGGRRTICCDQLMEKLTTRAKEGGKEAHILVIERTATGIVVSAPGVSDPMGKDHDIEWIEVTEGPYMHLKELQPGDAPVAEFCIGDPKTWPDLQDPRDMVE